jgi:hypothetical protein
MKRTEHAPRFEVDGRTLKIFDAAGNEYAVQNTEKGLSILSYDGRVALSLASATHFILSTQETATKTLTFRLSTKGQA